MCLFQFCLDHLLPPGFFQPVLTSKNSGLNHFLPPHANLACSGARYAAVKIISPRYQCTNFNPETQIYCCMSCVVKYRICPCCCNRRK